MKNIKRILLGWLAVLCVLATMPVMSVEASSVTVYGGCTSMSSAYNWGTYSQYNSILVVLPEDENDFWVKVTLPADSHVYAKCTYDTDYEGMSLLSRTASGLIDSQNSSVSVYDLDTLIPFLAVRLDNDTSTSGTYYICVSRGNNYNGIMYFTISMGERYKTGHATFNYSGTASNPGNSSLSLSGVDSSVLTLNLTNNTTIPNGAIVTSVSTSGTQSPSQGNVHHKIMPSSIAIWYTSIYASSSSGSYNISVSDGILAKQVWMFCYNVLATAPSTMKNVKLTLNWRYDIADTGYHSY